jgi:hypothetical protein
VIVFGSILRGRQYQVNKHDDNERHYDRFSNDPHYYRDQVLTPPPFGF